MRRGTCYTFVTQGRLVHAICGRWSGSVDAVATLLEPSGHGANRYGFFPDSRALVPTEDILAPLDYRMAVKRLSDFLRSPVARRILADPSRPEMTQAERPGISREVATDDERDIIKIHLDSMWEMYHGEREGNKVGPAFTPEFARLLDRALVRGKLSRAIPWDVAAIRDPRIPRILDDLAAAYPERWEAFSACDLEGIRAVEFASRRGVSPSTVSELRRDARNYIARRIGAGRRGPDA